MWALNLASGTRRTITHPVAPAVVLCAAALSIACLSLLSSAPVLVAWVVLALSAGYAISGSV